MNLVLVAMWIQEGIKSYYKEEKEGKITKSEYKKYVVGYVIRKGKGQLNPTAIDYLIDLETSVPDCDGTTQLC